MDKQQEFDFITEFIESSEDLYDRTTIFQLRCLWTAFCIHQGLNVDTCEYDSKFGILWAVMEETGMNPYNSDEYERFYDAMCKYLV